MSSKTKIKICGIKEPKTLDFTLSCGVDMVGFVYFAKSPRHLDLPRIAQLITQCTKHQNPAQSVVLLVNPDSKTLNEVMEFKPDFVQLHGSESPEFIEHIVDRLGQPIIKALPVALPKDLEIIPAYIASGATILLDAKPPENATRPGGLGEVFDWTILKTLDPKTGFLLSGGLNPENVAQAIGATRATGVDVSSGVESRPGQKDLAKIKQFIANATNALAN